ncbi:autophagy protein 5 [Podila epicladia]|nr:autophagy protein 5 [Podila epicladia]
MPPQPAQGRTPATASTSNTSTTIAPHNPVAKVIWDGSIPIQFSWDQAEAAAVGSQAVESFFLEAPRCSYFSLLTSRVRRHFVDMALHFIGDDAEVWYDYEGTPLKCQAVDSCQDYFMSMIKEVCVQKADAPYLLRLTLNDGTMARNLPVRIYLPENCPVIQEPMSPVDENGQQAKLRDGQPKTLRQILNAVLPDLFPLVETGPPVASAMVHGIIPSLETSAIWASQNMSYPDNFLHLVVIFK